MGELFRFNWRAYDRGATVKVAAGVLVVMLLTDISGQTWTATGLAALLAWLTNTPGLLKNRITGMVVFAAGAAVFTIISGFIGIDVWPNIVSITLIGFLGTLAMVWGTRSFMIGFSLICWAIYGPFLVAATSVENCLLAILVGTGVVVLLNVVGEKFDTGAVAPENEGTSLDDGESSSGADIAYVMAYAVTVALVLALTTFYGWVKLQTDPTLMAGGAYFIIGFEARKTWISGIGRLMGLVGGALVGLMAANLLGPGLILNLVVIAACGLSFGALAVHPAAWMFFFMVFVAASWQGLEDDMFNLTLQERFYGETIGVLAAMAALLFLQWWQNRRRS